MMMRLRACGKLLLALPLLVLATPGASAQTLVQTIGDTSLGELGTSVGVSGPFAVFGAPDADEALVYRRDGDGYVLDAPLVPLTPSEDFGFSVAIDGTTIVVGAIRDGQLGLAVGAAFVFELQAGNWVQTAKLLPIDGDDQFFGFSVDIDGDVIVVGQFANFLDTPGSAHVFRRCAADGGGWLPEQQLAASDQTPQGKQQYGISVAVSRDVIGVGDSFDTQAGFNSGAVYVYEYDGSAWDEVTKLRPGGIAGNGTMGHSLDIEDDVLVAGAPYWCDCVAFPAFGPGAVFVFERSAAGTWAQVERVMAANPVDASPWFGSSVDLLGDRLAVGAQWTHTPLGIGFFGKPRVGAVHLFERIDGAFSQAARYTSGVPQAESILGRTVGLGDDVVLAGAPGELQPGLTGVGAVYVFGIAVQLPTWSSLGGALDGISGPPALTVEGDLTPASTVTFTLEGARPNSTAVLVIGLSVLGANDPFAAPLGMLFKGGTLLPSPDILLPGLPTNADGELVLSGHWPPGLPSGLQTIYQVWVTDAAAIAGFSASNTQAGLTP